MKKRIALAAAVAMAISVGGMVPASAAKLAAPNVTTPSCARAGGTLDIRVSDDNVVVKVATGALDVEVGGSDIAGCTGDNPLSLTGLTAVTIKVDDDTPATLDKGDVTFKLEGAANDDSIANWGNIPMSIQATGTIKFDASTFGLPTRVVNGVVTEESFVLGTLTGAYYAGEAIEFAGGPGAESFDASAVVTTPVTATGAAGADTVKGGALGDSLTGGADADKLFGNAGDDSLTVNGEGGSAAADQAWGGAGVDTIAADDEDTVAPGDGSDSITLLDGTTLLYVDSSASISVNLTKEPGVVRSTAGDDYYTPDKEPVFIGSELADTMIGADKDGNDTIGKDVFYGGAGADTLVGMGADDTLWGGGGTDAIKGGEGNDTISGDSGSDRLSGGPEDDTILGGGGDDVMYGSTGDDVLRGRKGSDQAWGGKGTFDVCAAEVTDSCEFKK